jgi:hypothetical protein
MQLGRAPVKVERLSEFLKLYPNRKNAQILLHGFLNGFRVNYDGPKCLLENLQVVVALMLYRPRLNEVHYTLYICASIYMTPVYIMLL